LSLRLIFYLASKRLHCVYDSSTRSTEEASDSQFNGPETVRSKIHPAVLAARDLQEVSSEGSKVEAISYFLDFRLAVSCGKILLCVPLANEN
jgi:hypothetical protein